MITHAANAQEAQKDENKKECVRQFQEEAPQAWEKARKLNLAFERKNLGIEAVARHDGEIGSYKKYPATAETTLKSLGAINKLLQLRIPGKDDVVTGINSEYFFSVSKRPEENKWRLNEVVNLENSGRQLNDEYPVEHAQMIDLKKWPGGDAETRFLSMPKDYHYHSLYGDRKEGSQARNFFELKGMDIVNCGNVDYLGKNCVFVEFKFCIEVLDGNRMGDLPCFGKAIFQPDMFWALRYARVIENCESNDGLPSKRFSYQSFYEVNQEFDVGFVGGPRLVKRKFVSWNSDSGDERYVMTSEYTSLQKPFTHKDFTLSAYGIPEPDWYKPPKPWWFYTSIVGMVLVVVGAVVFHFGKRLWREGAAKQNNKKRK